MGLRDVDLAKRKTRTGASKAALFTKEGHPYATLAEEYARLVHGIEPDFRKIMGVGQYMEAPIFDYWREVYRERGITVRANSVSTVRPRYTVTPDGHCSCGGVIEVKNVSHYAVEHWDNGATPPWYQAQVQLQMHASGRPHAHVWALLGGSKFIERYIEADPAKQQEIVDGIDAFFEQHVEPRIPPATDDAGLLLTFNRPADTYHADGTYLELGDALAEAARDKSSALAAYDGARDTLAALMARGNVRELLAPTWTAKAAPADKDQPDGEWRLTFRRKRT